MTDEELEKIQLPRCWQCDSKLTSVRRAKDGWYYVGCIDCGNKRICDEKYLQYTIEFWRSLAEKFGGNR